MNRIISVVKDIFSMEELRIRVLNTMKFILLYRIGRFVILPGIEPSQLGSGNLKGILGLIDTFSGGAFSHASIFGLSVMPYISASIVIQLATTAIPYFQRIQKEGPSGRRRLSNITRLLTICISVVQAITYLSSKVINQDAIVVSRPIFFIVAVPLLVSGTMFCIWMGDRITDKGLGNGVSMLIAVGIIAKLPTALLSEFISQGNRSLLILIVELIILFFIIILVVLFTYAVRRIPLQYAKQMTTQRVYGTGQRQYLPVKLNSAGVMPIIFAQMFMFVPAMLGNLWADKSSIAASIAQMFGDYTWQYVLTFSIVIVGFDLMYTSLTINPVQIADDLKRNNSFIPGVKPGSATAKLIDEILSRIVLPGAIFLAVIANLPAFAQKAGVSREFSQFYGGTSLIIMVGVVLDTIQQVKSLLLMKHYEGMMQTGGARSRFDGIVG